MGKKPIRKKEAKIIARALYKIGLEFIYFDHGAEFAHSKRFDEVREIILGNKDFNGYLVIQKKYKNKNPECSLKYHFKKINSSKKITIFTFNYSNFKIIFDIEEREISNLEDQYKTEAYDVLEF